jgi:superfamily I DNA/RNA helicase
MKVLLYNDIDSSSVKKQLAKVTEAFQRNDFKAAEVKKMQNTGYYRAKLDEKSRLIFKFAKYENESYILALEVVLHHDYAKSRFLGGAAIDETKIPLLNNEKDLKEEDFAPLTYINPKAKHFHILDKILSFDAVQDDIVSIRPPLILIGSAGSGKTALTLEKIKQLNGKVLYITLSSYLVENSRNLYYSFNYDNESQEVDFLSFHEYINTINVPKGREITFKNFDQWIWKYKQTYKIKDTYKLFEEFKGVITGSIIDKPYLSKDEYIALGIKQSVFSTEEREQIYDLFLRYIDWLKEGFYYDSNLVSYEYLAQVGQIYDFVVVDEVQDITNVQLYLILKALKNSTHFILCGDSNQIVHPNFFSWANIKTMFYKQDLKGNLTRILATNYRNTAEVTGIANQLLLVKNARFGSIDKESTYLVKPNATQKGEVQFLDDAPKIKQDLDQRTRRSTKFAVLVMRNEDKADARKVFQTPLLFSVQEAKGLEYENIILFNIISGNDKEFREICNGVTKADLEKDLEFSRAKDKSDKSLEVYKFYINSLYVAITRAVKNLYVIEKSKKHDLLELLGLTNFKQQVTLKDQTSSLDEWQKEARKLELQGKQEQADQIRTTILQMKPVPWEVLTRQTLVTMKQQALHPEIFNKKAKDRLFEFGLIYNDYSFFAQLSTLKYRRADTWKTELNAVNNKLLLDYIKDNTKAIQPNITRYGVDFRNEYGFTPLMLATMAGALQQLAYLKELGANGTLTDLFGRNAFQIALHQTYTTPLYAKKIASLYPSLKTDSIRVKVKQKMVKINNHQAEYLLLNFTIAVAKHVITEKIDNSTYYANGLEVDDVLALAAQLPFNILPEHRHKRTYISSILAKNTIGRKDPYNKELFWRIRRGCYLLNPLLELEIDDEWVNIYDLIDLEEIKTRSKDLAKAVEDIQRIKARVLADHFEDKETE